MADETPKKPVSWLKKHSRLVAFAGALVVFTTFVLKEGFRDYLKDLVDTVDKAETLFSVRHEIDLAVRHIGFVENKLADTGDIRDRSVEGRMPKWNYRRADSAMSEVAGTAAFLQAVSDLVDKLPNNGTHKAWVNGFQK
ncbi:MAG: hypothetical protein WAN65_11570 [Candidatus Sulfotelmatobacter sp.]